MKAIKILVKNLYSLSLLVTLTLITCLLTACNTGYDTGSSDLYGREVEKDSLTNYSQKLCGKAAVRADRSVVMAIVDDELRYQGDVELRMNNNDIDQLIELGAADLVGGDVFVCAYGDEEMQLEEVDCAPLVAFCGGQARFFDVEELTLYSDFNNLKRGPSSIKSGDATAHIIIILSLLVLLVGLSYLLYGKIKKGQRSQE